MQAKLLALQERNRKRNQPNQEIAKDADNLDLTLLLNECWEKANFGYQINDDIKIPTTVAEMIQADAKRQHEETQGINHNDPKQKRMFNDRKYKFEAMIEYEKLFDMFEDGEQKVREICHVQNQETIFQKKYQLVMKNYKSTGPIYEKPEEKGFFKRNGVNTKFSPIRGYQ